MDTYHLAQLNIATSLADMEDPIMADFAAGLDPINTIAERSDGFIWRLKDESGNATQIQHFDDPNILVNMSVWRDVDSLKQFMFKTDHIHFLKRKKDWFKPAQQPTYVLWWIPAGRLPSVEEAVTRLTLLREQGDTAEAFTFKQVFAAPA